MPKTDCGVRVRIPPITSVENALRVYYQHPEITNEHIRIIFGKRSRSTFDKLKQLVKTLQAQEGVRSFQYSAVNTRVAYKAWGLDIGVLENSHVKLQKLGLVQEEVEKCT